ncbi:hypothetical protein [Flavobacterium sp. Arc2]|uniref:hypothetical protein n=1 Tax=Flavobacterium sp. Arc2 TaxID=3046685 RepID=UPI00352F76AB
MLSKTIERLKYLLLEYRFYFCSIALLLALLIYSYNKTLSLEKELHQKQFIFERRQKAYDEKAKQQREKLERRIKEINLHK